MVQWTAVVVVVYITIAVEIVLYFILAAWHYHIKQKLRALRQGTTR